MRKNILIVWITLFIGSAAFAQKAEVITKDKAGWHKIAMLNVSFKTDKDEVLVVGKDQFRQMKLKAEDANVDITTAEVYYEGDRTPQVLDINMSLTEGMETPVYDIRNTDINKVVLIYKTIPEPMDSKDRATIDWGLK